MTSIRPNVSGREQNHRREQVVRGYSSRSKVHSLHLQFERLASIQMFNLDLPERSLTSSWA